MRKRTLLAQTAACALLAVTGLPAQAAWPDKAIKLVTPFPPGGQVGTIAHVLSLKMASILGQPVVIEPRPGAAGTIAATMVAKAPKDGYTLLFGTSSMLGVAKYTYKNLAYDPVADFAPVGYIGNVTIGVFASQKSGIDSLDKLLAQAKAKPGTINFGSPGIGSASHLAGEMFIQRAGIKLVHVPYPSNTSQMTDLVGGQTQLAFSGLISGLKYAQDGRSKLIAVASAKPLPEHPGVPALGQVLPGYDAPAWLGIVAPAGTPAEVVGKLHAALSKAMADPEVQPLLNNLGVDRDPMSASAFGEKIRREMPMWEKAVKAADLKAR